MISFKSYLLTEEIQGQIFALRMKEGIEEVPIKVLSDTIKWYWDGYIIASYIRFSQGLTYFRVMNSHKEIYDYNKQTEGSIKELTLVEYPIIKINTEDIDVIPYKQLSREDMNYEMQ